MDTQPVTAGFRLAVSRARGLLSPGPLASRLGDLLGGRSLGRDFLSLLHQLASWPPVDFPEAVHRGFFSLWTYI